MIDKVIGYFYVVLFNIYFISGVGAGLILKYWLGGKSISLVTGIVVGMVIFDLIRHWVLK